MDIPYLTSLVIFLPAVGALLTLFLRRASSIRWTALVTTTVTFVLSLGLFVGYDPAVSTALAPQLTDVWAGWVPGDYDVKYIGMRVSSKKM